jgi:hypothetical protein
LSATHSHNTIDRLLPALTDRNSANWRKLRVTSWLASVPHFSLLCKGSPVLAGTGTACSAFDDNWTTARRVKQLSAHASNPMDDRSSTKVPRCMSMDLGRVSRVATAFIYRPCGLHLPSRVSSRPQHRRRQMLQVIHHADFAPWSWSQDAPCSWLSEL